MGLFSGEQAQPVSVAGQELICPVCGGKHFFQRETQLNTAGMTFLGLDWANACAENYYCAQCGYMFWFHPLP
ncbi:MAG: hypothetical protein K6B40_02560 [Firmicutes bacterium]|nr:hypothetical protein [Bacillota bacterium]